MNEETRMCFAALVEYMSAEVLELGGNVAKDLQFDIAKVRCFVLAIWSDEELSDILLTWNTTFQNTTFESRNAQTQPRNDRNCLVYLQTV